MWIIVCLSCAVIVCLLWEEARELGSKEMVYIAEMSNLRYGGYCNHWKARSCLRKENIQKIGFHCKKYLEKKVFHFADMSNAGCSSTKMSNTEYHITEIPDGTQMFETENILHNFPPLSCLKPNALQFLWNNKLLFRVSLSLIWNQMWCIFCVPETILKHKFETQTTKTKSHFVPNNNLTLWLT